MVFVQGELWMARSQDGTSIPAGEKVVVVGREGFRLIVRRAGEASAPSASASKEAS
jgi:membrane-bound ClpP family serine protease